jgi:predicted MPP superfamily phosphohydrolase
MHTLEELNKIQNDYAVSCGGYWEITEGCWKQNKISRNKIRALKREYGKCYIGNVNYYNKQRENIDNEPILTEYKKGMVYNFGCTFAIPVYSVDLVKLIRNYNKPHERLSNRSIIKEIEEIFNKVEELNGIYLNWV